MTARISLASVPGKNKQFSTKTRLDDNDEQNVRNVHEAKMCSTNTNKTHHN